LLHVVLFDLLVLHLLVLHLLVLHLLVLHLLDDGSISAEICRKICNVK
jgi:hypothetical protein